MCPTLYNDEGRVSLITVVNYSTWLSSSNLPNNTAIPAPHGAQKADDFSLAIKQYNLHIT